MKQQTMIFDGIKSVPPWDFDNERGWLSLSDAEELEGVDLFFQRVPWLHRAVKDRANNVAHMPWFITRGDSDFDSTAKWENKLKIMPSPRRLFHQIEQSLAMTNRAYLFLETNNSGYIKNIVYCNPYTIEEVRNNDGILTAYKRRVGNNVREVPVENIAAFYDPDYLTEAGPGRTSDASAALMAAGALYYSQRYIQQFFRRGAIKATILATEGASEPEMKRLQTWWEDVIQGIKNAWSANVLRAKAVTPVVIGEGLESLQNESLTREQRQEIAAALGVPESRMWSAAANYATREMDEKAYFEGTILPECDVIAEGFNSQVFTKAHKLDGYRLEARPETLDIFQVDNGEQAQAYSQYVGTGMKPSIAAQILGIELPAGMEYEDLDPEEPEPEPEPEDDQETEDGDMPQDQDQEQDAQPEQIEATPQEKRSVLKAWRRKAELALKKTGSAAVEFETHIIPEARQAAIRAALEAAKTNDDIRAAMETQEPTTPLAQAEEKPATAEWITSGLVGAVIGALEESRTPDDIIRIFEDARRFNSGR